VGRTDRYCVPLTPLIVQVEDDDVVKAYWEKVPGDRKTETEAEHMDAFFRRIRPLLYSSEKSDPAAESSASTVLQEKEDVENE
jgi:hypothetical protein